MVPKTFGEYPIKERSPDNGYLQHDWKKHKWLYKEKVGGKNRYFYTEAAHQAFLLGKKGKKALANGFTDRLSERIVNRAKKSKLVRAMFGGGLKDRRDKKNAAANDYYRTARINERKAHEIRAKAASDARKARQEGASAWDAYWKRKSGLADATPYTVDAHDYDRYASQKRKAAAKADARYKKTTLGKAEAHVNRKRNAEQNAEAQDRYDAAKAAAREKKKGNLQTQAASSYYQRDFIAKRKKEREAKSKKKG
jgi:hypothetical protein